MLRLPDSPLLGTSISFKIALKFDHVRMSRRVEPSSGGLLGNTYKRRRGIPALVSRIRRIAEQTDDLGFWYAGRKFDKFAQVLCCIVEAEDNPVLSPLVIRSQSLLARLSHNPVMFLGVTYIVFIRIQVQWTADHSLDSMGNAACCDRETIVRDLLEAESRGYLLGIIFPRKVAPPVQRRFRHLFMGPHHPPHVSHSLPGTAGFVCSPVFESNSPRCCPRLLNSSAFPCRESHVRISPVFGFTQRARLSKGPD
jgi:hypothetical protein